MVKYLTGETREGKTMTHHVGPQPELPAEAYALFARLREFLYRLPEGHPSRPGLHAAAVAAYCRWRESLAPTVTDATEA